MLVNKNNENKALDEISDTFSTKHVSVAYLPNQFIQRIND